LLILEGNCHGKAGQRMIREAANAVTLSISGII
jgi:hypothetical protein